MSDESDGEANLELKPDHQAIVNALQAFEKCDRPWESIQFRQSTHAAAMRLINALIYDVASLMARVAELEARARHDDSRHRD